MTHLFIESFLAGSIAVLALDNWRMRRRRRIERLAREAEDALGPPRIGDLDMPDPSDPRWKPQDQMFTHGEGEPPTRERVLHLGDISVSSDGRVYIGVGPEISGGTAYGKRVLHAYRRRLVESARAAK